MDKSFHLPKTRGRLVDSVRPLLADDDPAGP